MSQCPNCSADVSAGSKFCPNCGAAQVSTIKLTRTVHGFSASPPNEPSRESRARDRRAQRVAWTNGVGIGVAVAAVLVATLGPLAITNSADGTLVSRADGSPISGATISCANARAITDNSGRFHLVGLHPGRKQVLVSAGGLGAFRSTVKVKVIGSAPQRVSVPCAVVQVKLTENGPRATLAKDVTVQVAGKPATAGTDGIYKAGPLSPRRVLVEASGPSYEATQGFVELTAGMNKLPLGISLTPKAAFMRYMDAFKAQDWRTAYEYLAPDARAHYSFKTFQADMKNWGKPISVEVKKVQVLSDWTSPATDKKYDRAVAITRTLVAQRRGGRLVSTSTQHWVYVNGLWLRADVH